MKYSEKCRKKRREKRHFGDENTLTFQASDANIFLAAAEMRCNVAV